MQLAAVDAHRSFAEDGIVGRDRLHRLDQFLTVGSALYQRSLEATRDRVKERLVVSGDAGHKVAGAVARVTGQRPGVGGAPASPAFARPPGPGARPMAPQWARAVRPLVLVFTAIAGAVNEQDAATREISGNAQSAAQGNEGLVININSLSAAIGETNTAAASVLSASDDLAAVAETLSREVEKFFLNLQTARGKKAA